MRLYLKLLPSFLAVLVTGCLGSTTFHTATPIPKGETEWGIVGGASGFMTTEGVEAMLPQFELRVRRGVGENMDFGARINGFLLAADLNIAMMNEPDFAFSINPSVSTFFFIIQGEFVWIFVDVGVLADLVKTESLTVVTGLKPGYIYGSLDFPGYFGSPGDRFTGGLTAGVKIEVEDSLFVMPSIDILTPLEDLGDGLFVNAGVGILF